MSHLNSYLDRLGYGLNLPMKYRGSLYLIIIKDPHYFMIGLDPFGSARLLDAVNCDF